MNAEKIIAGIINRVGGTNFSSWRIGLTHTPEERRAQWRDQDGQDVRCWTLWEADSLEDAQYIESHFINVKGMQGGTGGDLSRAKPIFVYIF